MDSRIREDVFPVRIVESEGRIDRPELFTEPAELQIGLKEPKLVRVQGKAHIVFDFGFELNGSVRILTQLIDGGTVTVRLRTGESVSECCAELNEKYAHNHHSLRDVHVQLLNFSDLQFLETGFRFLRIDFPEETNTLIKAVTAVYVHRDLRPEGSFVCSDPLVNRIFEVARHTLELNMQNYIWDGVKRDRLVWVGDMHPETMGIVSLFGADSSVIASLEYSRSNTPLPDWMNNIPTYSMWWLVILSDYYKQNGNSDYLFQHRSYIDGLIRQIDALILEDGTVNVDSECLFDWPSHGTEDEIVGITALAALAARESKSLMKLLSLDESVCDRMLAKLRRFRRSATDKKQCEAMLVYAGLKPAGDALGFLTRGGSRGMSTFMSYYILSAVARAGKAEVAVDMMKQYYGAMLGKGATSFWEDFDMDWIEGTSRIDRRPEPGEKDIHGDFGKFCYTGFRHSLCHGWSCGPVPFLIREVGGIEPLEPGCTVLAVNPVSAGLEQYEIKYPTPKGIVELTWKKGEFTVKAPGDVSIVSPAGKNIRIIRS